MQKRRITLHGPLRKLAPEGLTLHAETVAEAINGLCKLLRIRPHPIRGRQAIKVVGFETIDSLFEKSDVKELHVVPAFYGAKSGVFQVIIGAVLIVVGAALMATGIGGPLGAMLVSSGIGMVLGGLAQLLFPVPTPATGKKFAYLGAPENTTKIGTPIAFLLGEAQAYGHILSYDVDAVHT